MNCSACNHENRPGVRFCENCGNQIALLKSGVDQPMPHKHTAPPKQTVKPKRSLGKALLGTAIGAIAGATLLAGALFFFGRDSSSSSRSTNPIQSASVDEPAGNGTPRVRVSPTTGTLYDAFTIEATGLRPNEDIFLTFLTNPEGPGRLWVRELDVTYDSVYGTTDGTVYTAKTDSSGYFFAAFTVDLETWQWETADLTLTIDYIRPNNSELSIRGETSFESNVFTIGTGASTGNETITQNPSETYTESRRCDLADATPIFITPNTGPISTIYDVSAVLGGYYPGDEFGIEVRRGGNQGALVYESSIIIDQNCRFELALFSEQGDQPGKYHLLVVDDDGYIIGQGEFFIEGEEENNTQAELQGGQSQKDGDVIISIGDIDIAMPACGSPEHVEIADAYDDLVWLAFLDIDSYWDSEFPKVWNEQNSNIEMWELPATHACQLFGQANKTYYDPFSNPPRLYVDSLHFLMPLFYKFGGGAVYFTIAHEYGHHVISASQDYPTATNSAYREFAADCYAGVAIGSFVESGAIPLDYLGAIDAYLEVIGDEYLAPEDYHPRYHGTAGMRLDHFYTGIDGRVNGCFDVLWQE